MKQKDIALLLIVVFVGGVLSVLITNAIFVPKDSKQQKAEKIEPISGQFNTPDQRVFNSEAINPTKLIKIGDNPTESPF